MVSVLKDVVLTASNTAGSFLVSNGQILTPANTIFRAKGVNCSDDDIYTTHGSLAAIQGVYPGCNFIRIPCNSYRAASYFDNFVNDCTNAKVVVAMEDHQDFWPDGTSAGGFGGGSGVVFTGSILTTETNWYAALATRFKANPYVWFMTCNEPPTATQATFNANNNTGTSPNGWTATNFNSAALSTWHKATIDAIRNTGNTNPICIDVSNPNTWGSTGGMTSSVYAAYHNILWDPHSYDWLWSDSGTTVTLGGNGVGYSSNQTTINSELKTVIQLLQTISSADGTMPCIIGEYGNSTNGQSIDPGGTQNCIAVQNSVFDYTSGCAAWYFGNIGAADNLTNGGSPPVLTAYGRQVGDWINAGIGKATGSATVTAVGRNSRVFAPAFSADFA